jgi:hypothetical protein
MLVSVFCKVVGIKGYANVRYICQQIKADSSVKSLYKLAWEPLKPLAPLY